MQWDLGRSLGVFGSLFGILCSILQFYQVWDPFSGWISRGLPSLAVMSLIIQLFICGMLIFLYGVVGRDVWVRQSFIIFLVSGIILVVFYGNLAGFIIGGAGILVLFGMD